MYHPLAINALMDQEKLTYIFQKYDLVAAPVVATSNRIIGMITLDDVVDVIDKEAEEELI